ncbi:MAG: TetR/AcrR family transcriptional regulator [Bacteroidota bacterium]
MKTKAAIKAAALDLFNQRGVQHITLRDIAKQLGKSYGNITYHFPKKEALVTALFQDFNAALAALPAQFDPEKGLLHFFFTLPEASFEITTQYLFLTTDYLELKRSYHDLFKVVDELNAARKVKWLQLMIQLQSEGWLRADISQKTLEYIMELSVSLRMFYFQSQNQEAYDRKTFCIKINQLLWPYLSGEGDICFQQWLETTKKGSNERK